MPQFNVSKPTQHQYNADQQAQDATIAALAKQVAAAGSGAAATAGGVTMYRPSGGSSGGGTVVSGVSSVGLAMPSLFSVAGSPVTSSGTFAVTLVTQAANTFLRGPVSGAAAAPVFGAITAADLPVGGGATFGEPAADADYTILSTDNGAFLMPVTTDVVLHLIDSTTMGFAGQSLPISNIGGGVFDVVVTKDAGGDTLYNGDDATTFRLHDGETVVATTNKNGKWVLS